MGELTESVCLYVCLSLTSLLFVVAIIHFPTYSVSINH